jgi:hypothetical protein
MRSIFWHLLHSRGPEWVIHHFCRSLCRAKSLCPKCAIKWETWELIPGPRIYYRIDTSANWVTTSWTITNPAGSFRSIRI